MWQEIVLVIGLIITLLGYVGLTPRRISEHAMATQAGLRKMERGRRAVLLTAIVCTVFLLCFICARGNLTSEVVLVQVFIVATIWRIAVAEAWRLSQKAKDGLNVVYIVISVLVLIGILMVTDMAVWEKIVFPAGGAIVGYGGGRLRDYVDRKRKKTASQRRP